MEKGKNITPMVLFQFEGEYFNGRRWNGKGYNDEGLFEFQIKYGKGNVK